jgi:hypothetical protein
MTEFFEVSPLPRRRKMVISGTILVLKAVVANIS